MAPFQIFGHTVTEIADGVEKRARAEQVGSDGKALLFDVGLVVEGEYPLEPLRPAHPCRVRNQDGHAPSCEIMRIERGHASFQPSRLRDAVAVGKGRSEEHTSELQSLMRISYAVF